MLSPIAELLGDVARVVGDLEGRYTDPYLETAGSDAPTFTDDEMRAIGSPLDFVGINVYWPNRYVEPSEEPPGYRTIPISASHPKMKSGWRILDPEIMYWALARSERCSMHGRFSSPRMAALPRTGAQRMAASTTPIG